MKQIIPLDGPPVGLAFAPDGTLYAIEGPYYGDNTIALRAIAPDGTIAPAVTFTGQDSLNFFVGGAAYDHVTGRILVTDNTGSGRLYSLGLDGSMATIATGINAVAGVAVRSTGEIFVSTARGAGQGTIRTVDRTTGASTIAASGLDYGAGMTFNAAGDLLYLEAFAGDADHGRLWQAAVLTGPGSVTLAAPQPLAEGIPAAGVVADDVGELFVTGRGGVFSLAGSPLAAETFDTKNAPEQFATAIAFHAEAAPFEPFAGPAGGRLAVMADYGFGENVDEFVTLFTPARPEDFDSSGVVDATDLALWRQDYGASGGPELGDANKNGLIEGSDFLQWQRGVSSAASLGSVPEPMALRLFLAGALGIFLRNLPTLRA